MQFHFHGRGRHALRSLTAKDFVQRHDLCAFVENACRCAPGPIDVANLAEQLKLLGAHAQDVARALLAARFRIAIG
jgi:hypothetical protein